MSSTNQPSLQKQAEDVGKQAREGMKQAGEKMQEIYDKNVTPEMKQQASQMKNDMKESLNQTQQQIKQAAKGMQKQMDRGFGPWLQQQRITGEEYIRELMAQPNFAKGLLGALLFTNLLCPLFFMNRAEGIVTFITYICVSILSHFLFQMAPKSSPNRLFTSTFSHLLWVPLIFWLASRSSKFDLVSAKADMEHVDVTVSLLLRKGFFFVNWLRAVLTVNSIALTLDSIKLFQILQNKSGNVRVQGQQGQQLPKSSMSSDDRHQLIDDNEGSNVERERQFNKDQEIKQRMKSTAPTA